MSNFELLPLVIRSVLSICIYSAYKTTNLDKLCLPEGVFFNYMIERPVNQCMLLCQF